MPGDLSGAKIAITRPIDASGTLTEILRQFGADVVNMPLFAIEPLLNSDKLWQKAQDISNYDLVICISRNAAEIILPYIQDPAAITWATIGPVTAKYLQQRGACNVICPSQSPFDSDSLLLDLQLKVKTLKNKCIMILAGADGNDSLAAALRHLGAQVVTVPLYRRIMPNICAKQLLSVLNASPIIDLMVVTCVTSLVNLQVLAASAGINPFGIPLLVVSNRISIYALEKGFVNVRVAKGMSDADIVTALLVWRNNT